jgi:hypothetical protein
VACKVPTLTSNSTSTADCLWYPEGISTTKSHTTGRKSYPIQAWTGLLGLQEAENLRISRQSAHKDVTTNSAKELHLYNCVAFTELLVRHLSKVTQKKLQILLQ